MSPPYCPTTTSMLAPHCEPRREEPRTRSQVLHDALARVQECRGYLEEQIQAERDELQQALRRREA